MTLLVTPRQLPAGETAVADVRQTQVTLTPRVAGNHWYQITASDGTTQSPPFHLTLPVFTPALGRDDSHAVVLYRFDEGRGNLVKDHGAGTPADLLIPAGAPVRWQPAQGLWVHGLGPIQTAGGVRKLMALAQQHAATIEAWIDTDTLCPPTDWLGGLLAWELPNEQRNFAVAHLCYYLTVMPEGATFAPNTGGALFTNCIRSGLQHVVVTWDGTVTRCYSNGEQVSENRSDWHTERWNPDAPLLLGSLAAGQGRYHDRIAASSARAPTFSPTNRSCSIATRAPSTSPPSMTAASPPPK